ncbi:MAG: hypothetical protein IJ856_05445 [Candidatus Methanomethylophilaceae archaeon]|nr:hypothetical protein [Candidatus Methanomethylophilaceae archaeon]
MAKKKRRIIEDSEEEYEFTPTEFNEREFILKDIYNTKVFLVMVILGLIVGIVGGVLIGTFKDMSWMWIVATAISFLVMGLSKQILTLLGFRPEMLDTKSMLGTYLVYLALGLGICMLIVNPPFFN